MLKNLWRFTKQYKLFVIALVGGIVALALDLTGQDRAAHWLLIAVMGGELIPLLVGMVQNIRHGTYGVDILAASAIVTAIILQEYWAGMVIVLMLAGGESLENYAEHRARRELDALLARAPQKARVLRGGKEREVPASEVRVGDKLVIRAGEVVPVDAVILEGAASFDESSLTGESVPHGKQPGDDIVSGSINLDGPIVARALHSAADSQYQQIIRLVRAAAKSKAPFVRLADRYAIPFTIISFGIAGTAWAFSGEAIRFLEVLVVATPCPLILAAPIAVISGMSRASKQGIIIKTGSALEQLATARTFAFDKTGTLTQGELVVDRVVAFKPLTRAEVLGLAAAVEQHSSHVLARAIVNKAQASQTAMPKVKNVHEHAGKGLTATAAGKEWVVGRSALLQEYGVDIPKRTNIANLSSTAIFVAAGAKLVGLITLKDALRPEATSTLTRLRQLGVQHLLMVTGDNKAAAKTIARHLGIKRFHAEALPGDKIRVVEKVEEHERPVAFVGDGVNDAPVLTASDVGVALGARGSTAATESADVVVMLDNLDKVADGREIARRTFSIAKQSISIGIGLSVALMFIFATGTFKPVYGAIIQEVIDIIVIFNALRAHGNESTRPGKPIRRWTVRPRSAEA